MDQESSLMVLLHGLGSNEEDLYGLSPYVDDRFELYCLRAPMGYFDGYKWFSLEITNSGVRYNLEEAKSSLIAITESIKEFQALHNIPTERTVLGGFSQGAMMSTALLLTDSSLASRGWLMSGGFVPELVPENPAKYEFPLRVLAQHGQYDNVLPIQLGKQAVEILETTIGASIEFRSYPMAHTISQESLEDARAWLD